ncbi:MAG TPA: HAD family phosphatase [Candidatus Limnocylindrales bacterium]|nr:HAD family phosphatase [Candidatus Limnocylindrales bacterium]
MTNASAPSPTRPAGLIFDLDGTLVDTVQARIDGWVEVLSGEGLEVSAEQVGPMIGMDGKRLARDVATANGRELDDAAAECIDRAAGEAFDRLNVAPRVLPGLADVLAACEELGVRWLIATSSRKEQVSVSVGALGLAREPDIVDGSHVVHAKPAPDLLRLAAERLGLPPGRCWAVGDSTWDIRAAVAAGMAGVGVTAGSAVGAAELAAAGAAHVVASLEELAVLLRGLGG